MDTPHGEVDLYETLQVHERAIPEVIEKAYRVLVRKYHPDVHPPQKRDWAHTKMTQLNVAYDVLSNPQKRTEYDAARLLGRSRSDLTDEEQVDARTLKCFNHPKQPSITFCWHCGRPICAGCFGGEVHDHTICVPCAAMVERDHQWRTGMDPVPQERPREGTPMGAWGLFVHYLLLTLLLAAILWSVYSIALAFGNTVQQALVLVIGLAVVFVVLVIQRLTWRVICPDCGETTGHAAFRAHAPWSEFLAPQPICPDCGRRFRSIELSQSFD